MARWEKNCTEGYFPPRLHKYMKDVPKGRSRSYVTMETRVHGMSVKQGQWPDGRRTVQRGISHPCLRKCMKDVPKGRSRSYVTMETLVHGMSVKQDNSQMGELLYSGIFPSSST